MYIYIYIYIYEYVYLYVYTYVYMHIYVRYRELVEDSARRDSRGDAMHEAGPFAVARPAPPAPG